MDESRTTPSDAMPVEAVLREELAHGDIVLGTIGPILGHLLVQHDHSLFSDEIVARVRGMVAHVARQLIEAETGAAETAEEPPHTERQVRLASALAGNMNFLVHCHALALEAQLARRLEERSGVDPVLSPLLQALIASEDPATASAAMAALAAQARFMQQHRRMELPLNELPGDLYHFALSTWRGHLAGEEEAGAGAAEQRLRSSYAEGSGRLGLLARLVSAMGPGVSATLTVNHAGVALFLSGLASASGQERGLVAIATNDSQLARLALALRAAGLKPREVEEQFAYLHPQVSLPDGFGFLRADRAAALLAASGRRVAG